MALHTSANDLAFEDIESSEQRRCAMMRIPEKATTLSGACRPRDPVDDDQGGARA
jgi:hypothetical protein